MKAAVTVRFQPVAGPAVAERLSVVFTVAGKHSGSAAGKGGR